MADHEGLPVAGYRPQNQWAVDTVNMFKIEEEKLLQKLETLGGPTEDDAPDHRWLAIGRTHLEQAFMAINRSVFKPSRISLED